jgi:hypothetical protein
MAEGRIAAARSLTFSVDVAGADGGGESCCELSPVPPGGLRTRPSIPTSLSSQAHAVLRMDFTRQDYLRDPATGLAKLRAAGPVVEVRIPIVGKTWITTTSDLAGRVLKDSETFTMRRNGRVAGLRWWMPGWISAYGIYFPSAYELLPVLRRSANDCLKNENDRASVLIKPLVGESRQVDIFSVGTWREIGWPPQLEGSAREDFLTKKLPNLLSSALEFLCDVGSYRPEDHFQVLRFVGDKKPTICAITLEQPIEPGKPFAVKQDLCPGDGTVPAWIAKEVSRSPRGLSRPNREAHDSLLGDVDFIGYLDDLNADLVEEFASEASKKDAIAATNTFTKLNYIPPASAKTTEDEFNTKNVATKTAENLGISPDELFKSAVCARKGKSNSKSRAINFRRFADISEENQIRRAWALNNSANIYLSKKNFANAQSLGKRALDVADGIKEQKDQRDVRDLKSKAAWTVAIAAKQLGQEENAVRFRDLAIKLGNYKAKQLNLSGS